MELINPTKFSRHQLPENISSKINMLANCNTTKHEAELFYISVECVEHQLNIDKINFESIPTVNVFFALESGIALKNSDTALGETTHIIMYNMDKIRELELNDVSILTVFTEELIHHFYLEEDEIKTKKKTFEAIKYKLPDGIEYSHIYKV